MPDRDSLIQDEEPKIRFYWVKVGIRSFLNHFRNPVHVMAGGSPPPGGSLTLCGMIIWGADNKANLSFCYGPGKVATCSKCIKIDKDLQKKRINHYTSDYKALAYEGWHRKHGVPIEERGDTPEDRTNEGR